MTIDNTRNLFNNTDINKIMIPENINNDRIFHDNTNVSNKLE